MAASAETSVQVAILLGGLGKRTGRIPKALIPVCERAFLGHQLDMMASHGVTDVVLCVGHQADQIERYVGDGRSWSLTVRFSHDGPQLLGTAGALRRALPLLAPDFVVSYGDSYVALDYPDLLRAHADAGPGATVAVYQNAGRWDRSNIVLERDPVAVYDKYHDHPRDDLDRRGRDRAEARLGREPPRGPATRSRRAVQADRHGASPEALGAGDLGASTSCSTSTGRRRSWWYTRR